MSTIKIVVVVIKPCTRMMNQIDIIFPRSRLLLAMYDRLNKSLVPIPKSAFSSCIIPGIVNR